MTTIIDRFKKASSAGRQIAEHYDKRDSGLGHSLTHAFYEYITPLISVPMSYIKDAVLGEDFKSEPYINPRWQAQYTISPGTAPPGELQNRPDMSNVKRTGFKPKPKTKKRARGNTAPPGMSRSKAPQIIINNTRRSQLRGRGVSKFARAQRGISKYPPVSYMTNQKSGFRAEFLPGRAPGCMRMRLHFRVSQIGVATVDPSSSPITVPVFYNLGGNAGDADMIIPINPSFGYYFPAYVTQLARLFSFFYVNSLHIRVAPRVNTSNTAVATLAYTADPNWCEDTKQYGSLAQAKIGEGPLTSLSNACTDVLYRPCTVYATNIDTKRKYVMGGPVFNGAVSFTTYASDLRQSTAGMFLISGTINGTDSVGTIYGDVYMGMDLELCQFGTPITTAATFLNERDELKINTTRNDTVFVDRFITTPVPKSNSRK